VLVLFWLLVLEGALRKWVAPAYAQYLFFVRDPFLVLLYWHALRANAFRSSGMLLKVGLGFALVAVLLAFIQSLTFGDARMFIVTAYGWRQYFLYLPLPFAMAGALNEASLARFARHAFAAVIVTAPIVLLQTAASPSAVINRGIADDVNLQFQSFAYTAGRIRPSGTFTSNVGVKELVVSTFALLLAFWLTPARARKVRLPLLIVATAAASTCLALSGSRAAFVHLALVLSSALLLGIVSGAGRIRRRALTIPLVVVSAGAILYPIVFPESLSLLLERVNEAAGGGSVAGGILGRGLGDAVSFISFFGETPLTGYGLGLGGNGRTYLGSSDPTLLAKVAAESDWARHIVDLGTLLGVVFILYRVVFTVTIFARALRASRRSASPLPLLLFGYVGIGLFYGQLTGHGTVGGFFWLYLGLCMAACRTALRPNR